MRYSEELRQLGADLRSIAVRGLLAAQDQVIGADFTDSLRNRIGSRQHVRTAEPAVGKQDSIIHTHHKSFPQNLFRLRRTHRQCRHPAAVFLFQAHCALDCEQIERIHLRRNAVALQNSRLFVDLHLRRPRHLLDADNNIHISPFDDMVSHLFRNHRNTIRNDSDFRRFSAKPECQGESLANRG